MKTQHYCVAGFVAYRSEVIAQSRLREVGRAFYAYMNGLYDFFFIFKITGEKNNKIKLQVTFY